MGERIYGCFDINYNHCCDSCHEDEDYWYQLSEFTGPDGKDWRVCCALLNDFVPDEVDRKTEVDLEFYKECVNKISC